jgi:hypothetical protein
MLLIFDTDGSIGVLHHYYILSVSQSMLRQRIPGNLHRERMDPHWQQRPWLRQPLSSWNPLREEYTTPRLIVIQISTR